MVAAIKDEKSADLILGNQSVSNQIIDDKHVRVDRAVTGGGKKRRKGGKKGKGRGGRKASKKGRRPIQPARKLSPRKGHKSHQSKHRSSKRS
uniref:Uncharacterized protein n=1 Tax=Panagrolaimus sp. ES5 TaxID=591445 RepID=A0AC34FW43_9BILA